MKKIYLLTIALALSVTCKGQEYSVFHEGLIGNISPKGWLLEFLQRQKNGLTGHPEAMAYPYNSCLWAGEIPRVNENPDAKDWWRYEQTAYYTDGLLRLGYLINDDSFIQKGEEGISYTIEHAQSNGRLGNSKIESLWPMAVFFRAMQANYWKTGDKKIVEALEKNYLSLNTSLLTNGRRHIVNIEGMLWVYGITGNQTLLNLAETAYNAGGFELDASVAGSPYLIDMHGVTYAEMLKIPLLLYAYTGKQNYLDLAMNAERKLERDHLLPDGLYTSAEYTLGLDVDVAHETCDITDYTWSLGYFLQVTGDAEWADRLERAVFNAGLGAISKDFKALQYFSSVNQLICTGTSDNNAFKRGSTWMAYRPVHETECCVGNVNRMMPNFASRLWMRGKDGDIVATLYSPNTTAFDINGKTVTIKEETSYPFSDIIRFTINSEGSTDFPLTLRIPGWCKEASLSINGQAANIELTPSTFVTLNRSFNNGDVVELRLPMEVRLQQAAEGQGWYVERGPLLYSYAIPQKKVEDTKTYSNMNGKHSENPDFKCWSITPDGPYNYGFDPSLLNENEITVSTKTLSEGSYPYDLANAPVSITIPVRKIQWSVQNGRNTPLPGAGNVIATENTENITLVPYGCTELRLTVFPEATVSDIPEETLIVNPDFEKLDANTYNAGGVEHKTWVPYGWNVQGQINGVSYGINNDALNHHGDNVCWFRLLPFSENFELYQVVPAEKLGAGTYRVTCMLWNNVNQKGNCRLFANQSVQYFGSPHEYINNRVSGEKATYAGYPGTPDGTFELKNMQVLVTLADGEDLRLGIRSDGRRSDGTRVSDGTGWFKVDYFKIEKVADEEKPVENTGAAPVFIVCGQSNSDGRIPASDFPSYLKTDLCNYCYDDGSHFQNGVFSPYTPHTYENGRTDRFAYDAFVYHYLQKSLQEPFYVVKLTLGGTAIDPSCPNSNSSHYWSCDPSWYNNQTATSQGGHSLMKSFERAFEACKQETLQSLKKGYAVKAILWHQGEGDRQAQGPANYYNNLKTLIAHMRQFLFEQTGDQQCQSLPFILGTVPPHSTQYNADVESAQKRIAEEDSNVYLIDLSKQPLLGDDLHFGVEAGEYFGKKVFQQLAALDICEPVEEEKALPEITNEVMNNPNFELATDGKENPRGNTNRGIPYGWQSEGTLTGNSFGVNKDAYNFNGNNVCWINATPMPNDFTLYQTIPASKLGKGTYTLTCKLWVEVNKKTNCRLFAKGSKSDKTLVQYYGTESDYTNLLTEDEEATYAGFAGGETGQIILRPLSITLNLDEDEDLTIGIKTGNMRNNRQRATDNAGWFKVDYFRLFKENETEPTHIENTCIRTKHSTSTLYDLMGRPMAKGQHLTAGIYINEGRKIVIK